MTISLRMRSSLKGTHIENVKKVIWDLVLVLYQNCAKATVANNEIVRGFSSADSWYATLPLLYVCLRT